MSKSKKPRADSVAKANAYARNGWYPATTKHHPPEIKEALRRFRQRPQIKCCHANCQQFLLSASHEAPELAARLQYVEGFVVGTVPCAIPHAWLLLDGAVLDLTLDPDEPHEYHQQYTASVKDIACQVSATGHYSFIHLRETPLGGKP